MIFITTLAAHVRAVNRKTGERVWRFTTDGRIWSEPIVADGRVFAGSADDAVYALDERSGFMLWRYNTGGNVSVRQLTINRRFILHRPAILFTLSTRQPEQFTGEPGSKIAVFPVRRSLKVKCSSDRVMIIFTPSMKNPARTCGTFGQVIRFSRR